MKIPFYEIFLFRRRFNEALIVVYREIWIKVHFGNFKSGRDSIHPKFHEYSIWEGNKSINDFLPFEVLLWYLLCSDMRTLNY